MSQADGLDSGFLLVDKPGGVTSFDVVAAARPLLRTKRVGHAGTLDPMATGLLVLGFGSATRLLSQVVGGQKTYEATIRLGAASTTDDAEGELVDLLPAAERTARLQDLLGPAGLDKVTALVAQRFTGVIQQVPSAFSALKIDGKRAYELARAGQTVELAARPVTIDSFELGVGQPVFAEATDGPGQLGRPGPAGQSDPLSPVDQLSPAGQPGQPGPADQPARPAQQTTQPGDSLRFLDFHARVVCSAGTYIRALVRDLGRELGVGGHLTALRRTQVGPFSVDRALAASTRQRTVTDRQTGQTRGRTQVVFDQGQALADAVLPTGQVVSALMPTVQVAGPRLQDLSFGRPIDVSLEATTAALNEGRLVALLEPLPDRPGWAGPTAVFIPQMRSPVG